jgi:hypothetical protein
MTSVATELGRADETELWAETRQSVIEGIAQVLNLEAVDAPLAYVR